MTLDIEEIEVLHSSLEDSLASGDLDPSKEFDLRRMLRLIATELRSENDPHRYSGFLKVFRFWKLYYMRRFEKRFEEDVPLPIIEESTLDERLQKEAEELEALRWQKALKRVSRDERLQKEAEELEVSWDFTDFTSSAIPLEVTAEEAARDERLQKEAAKLAWNERFQKVLERARQQQWFLESLESTTAEPNPQRQKGRGERLSASDAELFKARMQKEAEELEALKRVSRSTKKTGTK